MSILIKSMEMPKSCNACFFNRTTKVLFDDDVCALTGKLSEFNNKRADCPLIELPPHGRLIDADELCKRLLTAWQTAETEEYRIICEVMSDVVTPIVIGTPTVIEAEKEEE